MLTGGGLFTVPIDCRRPSGSVRPVPATGYVGRTRYFSGRYCSTSTRYFDGAQNFDASAIFRLPRKVFRFRSCTSALSRLWRETTRYRRVLSGTEIIFTPRESTVVNA